MELVTPRPWVVSLDSRLLTEHVSNALARHNYESHRAGVDPATGLPHPAPKRGGVRMHKTGRLADSWRRRKVSGSAKKAKAVVDMGLDAGAGRGVAVAKARSARADRKAGLMSRARASKAEYAAILDREEERGHRYADVNDQVMAAAVDQFLDLALDGETREPNPRAVKAKALG